MATVSLHSDGVLEPFAERHIPYELNQLVTTAEALAVRSSVTAPIDLGQCVQNALLESFLLHLRSLDDFLGATRHSPKDRPRDVLAIDFLPNWEPTRFLGADTRDAVQAQLAHLSTDRIPGPEHPWAYIELAFTATEVFGGFVRRLRQEETAGSARWADRFRPAWELADARLRRYEYFTEDVISS